LKQYDLAASFIVYWYVVS